MSRRHCAREAAWSPSEDRAILARMEAQRLDGERPDWRSLSRDIGRSVQAVATRASRLRAQQRALRSKGGRVCSRCGKVFAYPNPQGRSMLCQPCWRDPDRERRSD